MAKYRAWHWVINSRCQYIVFDRIFIDSIANLCCSKTINLYMVQYHMHSINFNRLYKLIFLFSSNFRSSRRQRNRSGGHCWNEPDYTNYLLWTYSGLLYIAVVIRLGRTRGLRGVLAKGGNSAHTVLSKSLNHYSI